MLFSSPEAALHINLAKHNFSRFALATPTDNWASDERSEFEYRILEGHYIEELRGSIQPLIPQDFDSVAGFSAWYESLHKSGLGQDHPLLDWLASECSLQQMKWFLTQEVMADTVFEDFLALTQLKLPERAKLECARNFWDEMGRGKPGVSQATLLQRMITGLDLHPSISATPWECLALNNTMAALATTRRYTYQSLGALGIIELISPQRSPKIAQGMRRLGMNPWVCSYYDLHSALNISHSRSWIKEIIEPLITATPECAQFIAEGAIMRLKASELCLNRYTSEFGLADYGDSVGKRYIAPVAPITKKSVSSNIIFLDKYLA